MNYSELFQAVRDQLSPDRSFCIEVKTWRHRHSRKIGLDTDTKWEIYVAPLDVHGDGQSFEGSTAQEAFDKFMKPEVELERETLETTSAAVGSAEVSA